MDRVRKFSMRKELTERELTIIKMLADGMIDDDSGRELGIKRSTIRHYITSAIHKTGSSNRASLVAFVLRNGLIK